MNWEKAEKHLSHIKKRYAKMGLWGRPALHAVIEPLFVRYEEGERTQEIYEKIMSLK